MRFANVTLECKYESKMKPLYIKWFHNDIEFVSVQLEEPDPVSIFDDEKNFVVSKNETTGDKVVLMNVDLSASGNYTCLVMGETSPFSEDQMTKVMTVVGIPDDQPSIEGDVRDHFAVGDIVNLTCTTPPSFPAATLSWFINGDKAPDNFLHEYEPKKTEEGLFVSRLRLNFQLSPTHFISGELRLKCVASIAKLYTKTNEHSQQEPPKADEPPVKEVRNLPEEGSLITTETSGSSSVWAGLPYTLVLHTLLIISAYVLH